MEIIYFKEKITFNWRQPCHHQWLVIHCVPLQSQPLLESTFQDQIRHWVVKSIQFQMCLRNTGFICRGSLTLSIQWLFSPSNHYHCQSFPNWEMSSWVSASVSFYRYLTPRVWSDSKSPFHTGLELPEDLRWLRNVCLKTPGNSPMHTLFRTEC